MDRIRVLEDKLGGNPGDVIEEAKPAAKTETAWIAMQGIGHAVAILLPGNPMLGPATSSISPRRAH